LKKDFGSRKQIEINENDESSDFMGDILKRAAKLRDQMDNAVDDDKRTPWESIHGVHNIPKSYVPPFQTNEMPQGSQPIDMDKLDNIIIDMEAAQSQPLQYGQ